MGEAEVSREAFQSSMDPRIEASRNAVTQLEPQNVADAQEATCCPTLVSEFSWDNVNLTRQTSHGTIAWVDAFGHDSNRCLSDWSSFFAFRCFNALLMCSVLVGAMIDQELNYAGLEYYFIFLTNWTLIVQCVYLVLACYVTHSLRELVASGEHGTELEMPLSVVPAIFASSWALLFRLLHALLGLVAHPLRHRRGGRKRKSIHLLITGLEQREWHIKSGLVHSPLGRALVQLFLLGFGHLLPGSGSGRRTGRRNTTG